MAEKKPRVLPRFSKGGSEAWGCGSGGVCVWGGVLIEKREIGSLELLVLGASFDGSKKVRAGGIGSCDPRGNIQWERPCDKCHVKRVLYTFLPNLTAGEETVAPREQRTCPVSRNWLICPTACAVNHGVGVERWSCWLM